MRTAFVVLLGIMLTTFGFSNAAARATILDPCDNEKADCCPAGRGAPIEWEIDDLLDCDLGPTAIDELLPE